MPQSTLYRRVERLYRVVLFNKVLDILNSTKSLYLILE